MLHQCYVNARTVQSPQTDATITSKERVMPEPTHHSYMLRLWRERGEALWHVTLFTVARPDERRHFDTLEDCFAYLREQAAAPSGPDLGLGGSTAIVAQLDAAAK
jgi:hypothetical protein